MSKYIYNDLEKSKWSYKKNIIIVYVFLNIQKYQIFYNSKSIENDDIN